MAGKVDAQKHKPTFKQDAPKAVRPTLCFAKMSYEASQVKKFYEVVWNQRNGDAIPEILHESAFGLASVVRAICRNLMGDIKLSRYRANFN